MDSSLGCIRGQSLNLYKL